MVTQLIHSLIKDFNPKNWISPFQSTSIQYLILMFLVFHGIGVIASIIGASIIENTVKNYQDPSLPHSLIPVIMAGPIEESLFFGIPFYLFGNNYLPLIGGIIWGMLHIFNTNTIDINQLDYANWLFVIPSLFFSLRTWISRKGWFAIIAHSLWNVIFFSLSCYTKEIMCSFHFNNQDISTILLATILLTITYLLVKRMRSRKLLNKV